MFIYSNTLGLLQVQGAVRGIMETAQDKEVVLLRGGSSETRDVDR